MSVVCRFFLKFQTLQIVLVRTVTSTSTVNTSRKKKVHSSVATLTRSAWKHRPLRFPWLNFVDTRFWYGLRERFPRMTLRNALPPDCSLRSPHLLNCQLLSLSLSLAQWRSWFAVFPHLLLLPLPFSVLIKCVLSCAMRQTMIYNGGGLRTRCRRGERKKGTIESVFGERELLNT